jgi:diguanylate cyclase (GGDEF)-like protein
MARKIRALAIFLAALLMPALGMAASAMNSLRSRTVTDPRGLIVDVRQQLDRSGAHLTTAQEVALLWGMGTAAINANDDAAFAEATLRLDGVASASKDPLAAAAAGFLRSRHDIANGTGDGMGEALRAADKVLGNADPELVAWARFQLCDAYTLDEKPDRALPLCRQVKSDYLALGDEWGVGDAENDEGIALATLNRVDDAARAYESSRRHFKLAGGPRMAVSVGDNLSQMYLKQGRAREALQLSQMSLKQELADGRVSDAIGSDTDIARAMAALGEHRQAYALMKATVAKARAAGMNGQLSDLLEVDSTLAEQAGDLHQALADEREVVKLENATNTPALRAIEAELEQRYAAREKQLRIDDLERTNRDQTLELKTAQAEAARRDEAQRRQKLANLVFAIVAVGLVLFAGLLFMLLREQRRHAAELRAQALCDPLTGIENRRAFQQRAAALLARQRDMRDPLHVMMLIDFDHFKRINDTVGHQQGDRVLVLVTDYLRRAIGNAGHIARIGGEEFIVLCPQLGAENGMRLAETLRAGVAALALPVELDASHITISIGVALFDGERCHDVSSWMRAADTALYSAKSYGRDRVVASTLVS